MASRMAEYREKSRRRKEMLKVTSGGVVILNCAKTLVSKTVFFTWQQHSKYNFQLVFI